MNEVVQKTTGPRGGEVFQKTAEEKAAIKKAKAEHKQLSTVKNGTKA
jgi:hypothetical protein